MSLVSYATLGVLLRASGQNGSLTLKIYHAIAADTLIPYAVKRLEAVGYSLVAVDTCLGSDGEWPYV